MLSSCLKCRKKKNSKQKTKSCKDKKGRLTLRSKVPVCDRKKSKFIKKQKLEELLSMIVKIPILDLLLM